MALRSPRRPDFWEYNCIPLHRPIHASEMIATADRPLAGCAHRLAEWTMLHDGHPVPEGRGELVEVNYDAVRELRDVWHREDFGEHTETETSHAHLGAALTAHANRAGGNAAPEVWIRPSAMTAHRLYERLGLRAVVETGSAILSP